MDTSTLAFESVADLAIRLREGSINSTSLVEQLLDQARLLLISAEACAINADFLDQHFDSLHVA